MTVVGTSRAATRSRGRSGHTQRNRDVVSVKVAAPSGASRKAITVSAKYADDRTYVPRSMRLEKVSVSSSSSSSSEKHGASSKKKGSSKDKK